MKKLQVLLINKGQERLLQAVEKAVSDLIPDDNFANWRGWPGTVAIALAALAAVEKELD